MSSVMAYFLFWMMFIHKQDCGVIRYHHNRNALEYVFQKYMNPLRRLSADLPNHAIEMEIEIHGSPQKEVKSNPRRFIRLINPLYPKPIPRTQDEQVGEEGKAAAEVTADLTVAPDEAKVPAAPAAPTGTEIDTSQKIPVFMEDLKKALDELENKLKTTPDNAAIVPNANVTSGGAPAGPGALNPPTRSIDDIVQLLKKAIHVENRMPKVGDEKLEWVQIKIPKSMQL